MILASWIWFKSLEALNHWLELSRTRSVGARRRNAPTATARSGPGSPLWLGFQDFFTEGSYLVLAGLAAGIKGSGHSEIAGYLGCRYGIGVIERQRFGKKRLNLHGILRLPSVRYVAPKPRSLGFNPLPAAPAPQQRLRRWVSGADEPGSQDSSLTLGGGAREGEQHGAVWRDLEDLGWEACGCTCRYLNS